MRFVFKSRLRPNPFKSKVVGPLDGRPSRSSRPDQVGPSFAFLNNPALFIRLTIQLFSSPSNALLGVAYGGLPKERVIGIYGGFPGWSYPVIYG